MTWVDGKPVKGVTVEFDLVLPDSQQQLQPRFSRKSGADGSVHISKLKPGRYYVIAAFKAKNDLEALLYLDVLARSPQRNSTFSMSFAPKCRMPSQGPAEWRSGDEQMPVKERVQSFSGVVYDPAGAPVANAYIKVIRRGTDGREQVASVRSDAQGRFATELPEGVYIGYFFSPGFKNATVPFEVTNEGSSDLRVTLELRSTT